MADSHSKMRRSILEFLRDVKTGKGVVTEEPGLGVNGYRQLYNHLAEGLTPDEFKAELDYLEEKGMVLRKPERTPRVQTKAEELDLAWYSITAPGIDELERLNAKQISLFDGGNKTSPKAPLE